MYTETTSGANLSAAQAITATANSTNVFDITGAGSGNAPAMIGAGGVNTAIGVDIGAAAISGMAGPAIVITNTGGAVGTGSGTVTFSLQSAPDNGSYSPGTYTTLYTSAAFVGTAITNPFQAVLPVPVIPPGTALPRFYRIVYTVSGTFSATFSASLVMNAPLIRDATLYGNNFVAL